MGGGRRHLHVVTDLSAVVVDGVEVVLEFAESKVSESEEAVFSFRKQITEEEEMRARSFDLLCCMYFLLCLCGVDGCILCCRPDARLMRDVCGCCEGFKHPKSE